MKMNFFVSLLALFPSLAFAALNVQQLNQQLIKNKTGWIAKEAWVSHLSPQELQHLMGVRQTPDAEVEFAIPQQKIFGKGLPASLDWRNYQNKNWVSPMLNQANCGSCVAFAATGVLETQLNIASVLPSLNYKLSPQYLFSCGGGYCDYGWFPESAASFLKNKGIPDEDCMPYTSGASGNDVSCKKACADATKRVTKITTYTRPSRGAANLDAVKTALLKGPLMTTLTVYEDFMVYSEGVYKRTSKKALGGHAVSIVGFDDSTRSWIIRNSWGEDWGEKGFAHISYDDDSGISKDTWSFQVQPLGGYVSTQFPKNYSYVTGNTQFSGDSSFSDTASLKFNVIGASKNIHTECKGTPCGYNVDTTHLADGRYEVETIAHDANGVALGTSPKEFFYVLNSVPTLALSFQASDGLNLTKPLAGRIELNVSVTANPVPMSSLEFHIIYPDGHEQIKHSDIVMDQMHVGWRTNLVPNGKYQIFMLGKIKTNTQEFVVKTPVTNVEVKN